ncbi:MAG: beta-ketoacyl synthase N-terminal-like domain-containing protein [Desulfuromonadaceae bacterium]
MLKGWISGIGWVTVDGCGQGRRGDAFALSGGELPVLARADVFSQPDRRFGRMDPFSRLGLAGIAFALRDAGLEEWDRQRSIGLIAATTYGCLATDGAYFDTVIPEGGALASPQLFAYTLPNTFLGEAAIRFGLTGSTQVVSSCHSSGLEPLALALECLNWEEEGCLVAGVCDLNPPPGVAAVAGALLPGAVFLVLERELRPELPAYGELVRAAGGELVFAGSPVADVGELVRRCLADRGSKP